MKAKLALIVLAAILIATVPVAASGAGWEVLIPSIFPSASSTPADPLPVPGPVELFFEESIPAPALHLAIPVGLQAFMPAPQSGKALFDANLFVMIGLNVADYFSTREAFKYPGLTETNPLMAPFVKSPAAFAAIKAGTTALTYLSMKSLFKKNKTVAWIMTTASNVVLSYVVANNLRLIQSARTR
jgi:hypothetical protein